MQLLFPFGESGAQRRGEVFAIRKNIYNNIDIKNSKYNIRKCTNKKCINKCNFGNKSKLDFTILKVYFAIHAYTLFHQYKNILIFVAVYKKVRSISPDLQQEIELKLGFPMEFKKQQARGKRGEQGCAIVLGSLASARDEVRRINEEYEGKDLGLVLELVDDAAFTFAAAMTVHGTPDETSRLLKKHGLEDLAED